MPKNEGYSAVVIDTVSDSGLRALRSRLSIPVLGPGRKRIPHGDDAGQEIHCADDVGRMVPAL